MGQVVNFGLGVHPMAGQVLDTMKVLLLNIESVI